jgi:integrase
MREMKILWQGKHVKVVKHPSVQASSLPSSCHGDIRHYMAMRKAGLLAHVVLGKNTLDAIDAYLKERNDESPWIFIQHGRTSAPPRRRSLSAEGYRRRKKGHGAQMGTGLVRKIVINVAKSAGFNPKREFVSAHSFRHWHAQRLIRLGASIAQV